MTSKFILRMATTFTLYLSSSIFAVAEGEDCAVEIYHFGKEADYYPLLVPAMLPVVR